MKDIDFKVLEKATYMLRTAAHPARIVIINLLINKRSVSVKEIQSELGITQSMTSQHLSALRSVGILDYEKKANIRRYFIKNKNVIKLLECIENCAKDSNT